MMVNNPLTLHTRLDRPITASRARRCRGSAMMEMVLAMPFVFVVLSLLLFLGWGMERMHRSIMVDRYEAWRAATKAPGPRTMGAADGANHNGQLNSAFFANSAGALRDPAPRDKPFDPPRQWRNHIGRANAEAGQFADSVHEDLPIASIARFNTSHQSSIPFWSEIESERAIDHQHTRLGHDWRFVNHVLEDDGPQQIRWFDPDSQRWHELRNRTNHNGSHVPTLLRTQAMKDTYFRPLDNQVQPVASSGNGLGRMVRALYMATPHYRGPKIPRDWIENYNRAQQLGNASP